MHYDKKRIKTIALLGVILLLGICGCNTEEPVPEEQKQESASGTVTEAEVQKVTEITQVVDSEAAEITRAVTEQEVRTTGEVKPTDAVEAQPSDVGKEKSADNGETEPVDTGDTEEAESMDTLETESTDIEEPEIADMLKKMEPEELVLHVLTNAEGVHFTSGGVGVTELLGYVEEKDVAYFIMKKQNGLGFGAGGGETIYVGVLKPTTGELIQHYGYGNTTADAVMIEKETGRYILYATECRDFGLHSGYGGVLLAKDGTLTQVWPVTSDGIYDDDYWNQHTARLNGETLERYKVIVTEVSPGDIAIRTEIELERTLTLDEILAGAV